MRRILSAGAFAMAMSIAASAQDSTIRSRTDIKTDDAKVFSMTGCLQRDAAGNFSLHGTAVKSREGITTETKVETETDRDEQKVTTTTRTRAEDGRVGTAGTLTTFMLTPRDGVALNQYVGQQVQLSAIMIDPDEKDAEVKIEDKVRVDPEHADSSTRRTKTEVEIERGAAGHYTVMTVKPMGGACK
ncbi:MAG TPA: hypothetical protein VFO21_13130 [Vicinamibacterales bacterium]|jgi:hypothetical protein|nr:hypothetical protein [Vicinamibacterales bacterium]